MCSALKFGYSSYKQLSFLKSLSNTGDLKETRARTFIFIEPEPRQRKPAERGADLSVREHLWFFMHLQETPSGLWDSEGCSCCCCPKGMESLHVAGVGYGRKASPVERHLVRSTCLKLSHRPLLLGTSSWVLPSRSTPGTCAWGTVRRNTDMGVRQAWILICISLTLRVTLGNVFLFINWR